MIRGFTIINGDVMDGPFSYHGGALYIGAHSTVSIQNCVIAANQGGAVLANGNLEFINCSLITSSALDGGAVRFINRDGYFKNCLVWGNLGNPPNICTGFNSIGIYSNFEDGQGLAQCDHCIMEEPSMLWGFCRPLCDTLTDASINIGAPDFDVWCNTRPAGFKADIGADEHYALCSSTGDVNADGVITVTDTLLIVATGHDRRSGREN